MSKEFYKDIKVIKFCKRCKVEFRPVRSSFFAQLGLCYKCRKVFYKEWYRDVGKPFFLKLSPEKQQEVKSKRYNIWKKWVEKNILERRTQALKSYHLNKEKHKTRKHRRTRLQ